MILCAEKLKREMGLSQCLILCANESGHNNFDHKEGVIYDQVDTVAVAYREILKIAVRRFGFGSDWKIFLETELENEFGQEVQENYFSYLKDISQLDHANPYFSRESAHILNFVGQKEGGVKLGWFMHRPKNFGGKVDTALDEVVFDKSYVQTTVQLGIDNTTTFAYTRAGCTLFPKVNGEVGKTCPYICVDPNDRILLSPYEVVRGKLADAYQAGGGLKSKFLRGNLNGIVNLFEQLVLKNSCPDRGHDWGGEGNVKLVDKLEFILDYIFASDRQYSESVWRKAFDK